MSEKIKDLVFLLVVLGVFGACVTAMSKPSRCESTVGGELRIGEC